MGISDGIARFLEDILRESGVVEIQRSELAQKFACVPSQINYVLSTRFSPARGFVVESRRGGGGYIRISRIVPCEDNLIMHAVNGIGTSIDSQSAQAIVQNLLAAGVLTKPQALMMLAAASDAALRCLSPDSRPVVRASILQQCLLQTAL